jgi:hypothetical protein
MKCDICGANSDVRLIRVEDKNESQEYSLGFNGGSFVTKAGVTRHGEIIMPTTWSYDPDLARFTMTIVCPECQIKKPLEKLSVKLQSLKIEE